MAIHKQSEKVNLVDYVTTKLMENHNIRLRKVGGWYRFPAVWRGSRDYNIAINENGTVWDHTRGESITISDLMRFLGDIPDPDAIARARSKSQADIETSTKARIRWANEKWKDGIPLTSPCKATAIAKRYLESRGIPGSTIDRVKPHIRASLAEGPMMLTPIVSPISGTIIGVQRYFLNEDSTKRTPDDGDSKMMLGLQQHQGYAGGVLINGDRFRFPHAILAVCEGYETGLAIHAASGMPVYVTYNAGNLERVNLTYLAGLGIEGLVICGDNDRPDKFGVQRGQKATIHLASRVVNEVGITPMVAMPDVMGEDWLDVFCRDPGHAEMKLLHPREWSEGLELELTNSAPEKVTIGNMLGRRYIK
jgi:hypothetical protein